MHQIFTAPAFATGGGGTIFELKVQAQLLAALLVNGHVAFFEDALIQTLDLQTARLGYETDDALVTAVDRAGRQRRQLWSMKHKVRFTDSDQVFAEVVKDAWADLWNGTCFDRELDAIVLATGPLSETNRHLVTLLDIARAAPSLADFQARVERQGFTSQKSRDYLAIFQTLCNCASGREVPPDGLWAFLRCLHVVAFDFDQPAGLDEARVKTLLAIAARAHPGRTGEDLWNAIFAWVAEGNPRAGHFSRDSLPLEWREAAGRVETHFETGAVYRLLDHTAASLRRIRHVLGPNLHLPRAELLEQVREAVASEQFTLVTGVAGVGKSAVAVEALRYITEGAPLFVVQAAEFARDSLEHALGDLRIPDPIPAISALFAMHPRKFLLVESVERLLESTQRDAFFDLLGVLARDPTWRVVLSCRQHAVELVRAAFFVPQQLRLGEVVVPILTDAELDYVIEAAPALRPITTNARTREFLRNPWFLDRACAIDWTKEPPNLPLDQARLREILWGELVIREDVRVQGLHLERDRCFRDIALSRARSLQSFVAWRSGQERAVQALVADELLVEEPVTHRVAPAHDVLEDWALVRWVAETHIELGQKPSSFFGALGYELPIRRSYRQWLNESLAGSDVTSLRSFVEEVLAAPDVEAYWKDETLVSVLLSADAPRFVDGSACALLANEKRQLYRVIHLLRTACKKPRSDWLLSEGSLGSEFGDLYLVPDGEAWGALVRLIHQHLDCFKIADLPVVLGLLGDWKEGNIWRSPAAYGAREAGLIALHYWNLLGDHRSDTEQLDRLASVLLAVSHAIPAEFDALLGDLRDLEERSERSRILEEKVLVSLEGWSACRSHPKSVADLASKKWGLDQSMQEVMRWSQLSHIDLNEDFGLAARHLEYFPASALQAPFLGLLRTDPGVGMGLILRLVNVATERYVELGLLDAESGKPIQLQVDLGGGRTCKQWANKRLWLMHRGGMPGPDLLQSALMALERWLLDLAESGRDLRSLTRSLILSSNNVCVTAVVASVALAYPDKVGDTALALIRTPEFFDLDLQRFLYDRTPVSSTLGEWLDIPTKRVYSRERATSDQLPHRKRNLEELTLNLQIGPLRPDVWGIIDDFKQGVSTSSEQSEEHKLWRLRLHRIDLRNFELSNELKDGHVVLTPSPPDKDVAEMIEKHSPAIRATGDLFSVSAWGTAVFEGRDADKFDPGRWREMLDMARCLAEGAKQREDEVLSRTDAAGYAVAVCVRDHWNDLALADREWCREFLVSEVLSKANTAYGIERYQKFSMACSRAAAQVLPLLLNDAGVSVTVRVRYAIAVAITHPIEEVQQYMAVAIGRYLWSKDSALAWSCVVGLLDLAQLQRSERNQGRKLILGNEPGDPYRAGIEKIRAGIVAARTDGQGPDASISIANPFCTHVLPLVASAILTQQHYPPAQRLMERVAQVIVRAWELERQTYQERDYHAEAALKMQFAEFVARCEISVAVRLWEPFLEIIPHGAREVADVLRDIICAEDRARKGAAFWAIWRSTKEHVLDVSDCHERMASEHSDLGGLTSALLLNGVPWKEDAKGWEPLLGHETDIQRLFEAVGAIPVVCKSFIRLIDSVGGQLLPEALVWLDQGLQRGAPAAMIGDQTSLFHLARVLTPLVFSRTAVLRGSPRLRDSTLRILEAMIDQGSSVAFRMRDFLVSPFSPAALQSLSSQGS